MGPPGVGKGTEAEFLIKQYQIPHISTGQMFRDILKEDTPLAHKLQGYMSKGELIPDELTNQVVEERLNKDDVANGFLFDGYPRTINQAEALNNLLEKHGWEIDGIINITAPKEIILERLSGRWFCPHCGRTYHLKNKPPLKEGVCDNEGEKLIQREDDRSSTVVKRLEIYEKQTAPLIAFYENYKAFMSIDGSVNPEATHERIMKVLVNK